MPGLRFLRRGLGLLRGFQATTANGSLPASVSPLLPGASAPAPASPYLASFLAGPLPEMACESRRHCQSAYLGDHTVLCRVLGKYLLFADTTDISLAPHLILSGYWEAWITQAVARIVKPGWHCVDVGANHGYYSLLLADAVGPAGQLLACEPNPRLADLLARTLEVNGFRGRAAVVPDAVADADGQMAELTVPQLHSGGASIQGGTGKGIAVRTVTLDTLCQSLKQVDFIKIDAEGAEERIWQGMRQTLHRNPGLIVLMEFAPERYRNAGQFLDAIEGAGFPLRHVDVDGQIKQCDRALLLAGNSGDFWMLWLQRN